MAAQELTQRINLVSERSTSAVATARFPDFVQQHWIWPKHLRERMPERRMQVAVCSWWAVAAYMKK
jgi:hypothetical protein